MRKLYLASLAALCVSFVPAPASAGTLITGLDAMREWNLIVLGNLTSSSEVEGRTFVGGNLTGNSSNYSIRQSGRSANGTAGLTVVGDVSGGHKNLNNGSGADIGGTVYSGFNLNGAPQTVNAGGQVKNTNINQNTVNANLGASFAGALAAQGAALTQSLGDLSSTLAGMSATNAATFAFNKATFDVVPDSMGQAVFSITAGQLDSIGEIQFNLNGAKTVIVNVSGANVTLNDNFLGSSNGLGQNVLWNFSEATTLNVGTRFAGSVLAPNAVAQLANYVQGSTVVKSMQQNGEIHLGTLGPDFSPTPSGAVPEPATWAMLVLGFGMIGGGMRAARRRTSRLAFAA
ncbi:collagen-binding domain-containing protein [Qipengyuania sp.]|uniref:collagen-binding domain-containing protein n=1 Tax=Qipengyuania sp. TaxID=2004515 RepID=UPI0035C79100